ncbi:uncharacterized protein UMAG_06421 [Mycosarcoma maydis]|uniref:Uncharacterized protein n=1 Tax=Mycosarcoma maydis TaxID=5270 RepID=A0A0D1BUE4_MYCMD|nr:uncharacterized protein UMAG_06421 [Ustilago maydis 521]KIS65722.1 hypothetical protein UMAG_06421 [Ustilago maydis 521]|eukprot:XP_011392705.1 hypothetical protein UMAG_06421 [Ustilago maydis 521]
MSTQESAAKRTKVDGQAVLLITLTPCQNTLSRTAARSMPTKRLPSTFSASCLASPLRVSLARAMRPRSRAARSSST